MTERALDLAVLVADKDIEQVVLGLLEERQRSLGISVARWDVRVHPQHDPGVLRDAATLLRSYANRARHALAMLDHDGSGREASPPEIIEQELSARLANAGWEQRAATIVIAPEVEVWAWSDSPHVGRALGWTSTATLRAWLAEQSQWPADRGKPPRPKEAFDRALREAGTRRSSGVFRALAETVGIERCEDASFRRLTTRLRSWFPAEAGNADVVHPRA